MDKQAIAHPFDRRLFLAGTGALALAATGGVASSQPAGHTAAAPNRRLRQMLADFVVGFDLKAVPAEVIARARVAFIDTIGVAIAGSHEEVSHIVVEMVKLEGSVPQATIIGQSVRASPQLAALANGVANHAMDYDFTFLSGQSVAPVVPALLAVAETTGATPADALGAVHRRLRGRRAHVKGEPAAEQWRRLAHHRHCRRHRGDGGLREADETSASRRSPTPSASACRWRRDFRSTTAP